MAAKRIARQTRKLARTSHNIGPDAYKARHPGIHTPLWNILAAQIKNKLLPRGAKARLACYLGLPRQTLTHFLNGRRLPDAELALRLLNWLVEKRNGRDPLL